MPTEPTLTVADKEDGTGATATIAGGDVGQTNRVFTSEFTGATGTLDAWTLQGTLVGNGNVDLPVGTGYFFTYVESED